MTITTTQWLITSDVAHEAAFRIDVPESGRGTWMLSYLPTDRRLTRAQALTGMVVAEMILMDQLDPTGRFDLEIAELHAAELGLTLHEVMCLLALRARIGSADETASDPADRIEHAAASA
ncbi:hypothetical protein OG874_31555 [Nocardia sp. NBC_00565]|uniref:hypothetical protein n=1 Tax=Nocardia sp. NBC_00565 TaxID=2975993 RepID=UPI002E80504D|nr:hypothetical protein [Nocardia sp. NBC_00565]WUC01312.1 hypothetical protein OG874_31555 [Nocardia sp. NBC_00565]